MPEIDESDRLLAHGQAALVLVEGVLLVLIEAGIVDKGQILEAIETAISTKRALSDNEQESRNVSVAAIGLLSRIENSLLAVRPDGSDPARVTRITVTDPSTASDQVTEQVRRAADLPGKSHRDSAIPEAAPAHQSVDTPQESHIIPDPENTLVADDPRNHDSPSMPSQLGEHEGDEKSGHGD